MIPSTGVRRALAAGLQWVRKREKRALGLTPRRKATDHTADVPRRLAAALELRNLIAARVRHRGQHTLGRKRPRSAAEAAAFFALVLHTARQKTRVGLVLRAGRALLSAAAHLLRGLGVARGRRAASGAARAAARAHARGRALGRSAGGLAGLGLAAGSFRGCGVFTAGPEPRHTHAEAPNFCTEKHATSLANHTFSRVRRCERACVNAPKLAMPGGFHRSDARGSVCARTTTGDVRATLSPRW